MVWHSYSSAWMRRRLMLYELVLWPLVRCDGDDDGQDENWKNAADSRQKVKFPRGGARERVQPAKCAAGQCIPADSRVAQRDAQGSAAQRNEARRGEVRGERLQHIFSPKKLKIHRRATAHTPLASDSSCSERHQPHDFPRRDLLHPHIQSISHEQAWGAAAGQVELVARLPDSCLYPPFSRHRARFATSTHALSCRDPSLPHQHGFDTIQRPSEAQRCRSRFGLCRSQHLH